MIQHLIYNVSVYFIEHVLISFKLQSCANTKIGNIVLCLITIVLNMS